MTIVMGPLIGLYFLSVGIAYMVYRRVCVISRKSRLSRTMVIASHGGEGAMGERFQLMARKQDVRNRIERLRRQLEHERNLGERANRRRLRTLENQLERLMAEEYNLRGD